MGLLVHDNAVLGHLAVATIGSRAPYEEIGIVMTRIAAKQLPQKYRDVIEEQVAIFARHRTIEKINKIPDTADIPIEDPSKWPRIPDVICVYVDMLGSEVEISEAIQLLKTEGVQIENTKGEIL